jgi:hypothetical protein
MCNQNKDDQFSIIYTTMKTKYPKLPESEIVGSDAWMQKVQGENFYHLAHTVQGIEMVLGHEQYSIKNNPPR